MPTTDQNGLVNPVSAVPGHDESCSAPPALAATLSWRPLHPPTLFRPMIVSGSSAATITKNWSTSL